MVVVLSSYVVMFFFFMQKTAYEMRISDWSSDLCSSDLNPAGWPGGGMLMAVLSRNDAVKPCDLPPSWAVAAGAIEAWIVSAEPGDEIVYASGDRKSVV